MFPLSADVERSFFRSRVRLGVALALFREGPLYARQLQRATGHASRHILGGLHGGDATYARGASLIGMGLVRARWTVRGILYELTDAGRIFAEEAGRRERARVRLATSAQGGA